MFLRIIEPCLLRGAHHAAGDLVEVAAPADAAALLGAGKALRAARPVEPARGEHVESARGEPVETATATPVTEQAVARNYAAAAPRRTRSPATSATAQAGRPTPGREHAASGQ